MRDKIRFTITVKVDSITRPEGKELHCANTSINSHGEITISQGEIIVRALFKAIVKTAQEDPTGRMLQGLSREIESFMNKGGH